MVAFIEPNVHVFWQIITGKQNEWTVIEACAQGEWPIMAKVLLLLEVQSAEFSSKYCHILSIT